MKLANGRLLGWLNKNRNAVRRPTRSLAAAYVLDVDIARRLRYPSRLSAYVHNLLENLKRNNRHWIPLLGTETHGGRFDDAGPGRTPARPFEYRWRGLILKMTEGDTTGAGISRVSVQS